MGPFAVFDYNICQSLYLNPMATRSADFMPESTLSPSKGLFGLCNSYYNSWEAGFLNIGEKRWLKNHLPKKSRLFTNVFEQQLLKKYLFITGENNYSCGVIFVAHLESAIDFNEKVAQTQTNFRSCSSIPNCRVWAEKPTLQLKVRFFFPRTQNQKQQTINFYLCYVIPVNSSSD